MSVFFVFHCLHSFEKRQVWLQRVSLSGGCGHELLGPGGQGGQGEAERGGWRIPGSHPAVTRESSGSVSQCLSHIIIIRARGHPHYRYSEQNSHKYHQEFSHFAQICKILLNINDCLSTGYKELVHSS